MAKVFITGSADGLGLMAGRLLAEQGHAVVLHARNESRAAEVKAALPEAESIVVGDLSTLAVLREIADQANRCGRFDAVIHNAGIGYREGRRVETVDGFSQMWAVNVLAPYVLTALMQKPDRLIYLTSGMHFGGDPTLKDLQWSERQWNGSQAYSDTKFHDVLLAFGMTRHWPDVLSNAVDPGWVPTRMGGPRAPDNLKDGFATQAWLAVSEDGGAHATGKCFYHLQTKNVNPAAQNFELQNRLLQYCRQVSGIALT